MTAALDVRLLKRFAVALGLALTMLVLALAVMPSTGSAHDTDHCYHGDINPAGGWYNDYLYHYTTGSGAHYNVYDHYLYGYWEHTEYNRCN